MVDLQGFKEKFDAVKEEVGKVIVGYEDVVDDFMICMMTGGHLLLEGVPGIAKTTLIKVFAQASNLEYERIQFTQDLLPADITGHFYFQQKTGEFELRKGPIFAQVLMADEINRAPPKTQSALIEAMQERQVTIEGKTLSLPSPFMVIATRNPVETEGVYPLPEAQMDRFMIKSDMDYLSPDRELDMLKMKNDDHPEASVESIRNGLGEDVLGLHESVHMSDVMLEYIRNIALETRNVEELVLGASPRAGEHLLYSSKSNALLRGRDFVIPDDVKDVVNKVLPHRLLLSVDAEMEGLTAKEIVRKIVDDRVEAPKGDFQRD